MSEEIIDTVVSEYELSKAMDKIITKGKHGIILSNGNSLVLLLSRKSSLCLITKNSIDIRVMKYLDQKALKDLAIDLVKNCGGEIIGEL